MPENVADAWTDGGTSGLALAATLSNSAGVALPWALIRRSIEDALRARFLELAPDSGPWPCGFPQAQEVKLQLPTGEIPTTQVRERRTGLRQGRAELQPHELQDLADRIGEIAQLAAGLPLFLRVTVELGGDEPPTLEVLDRVNTILGEVNGDLRLE